ncbi:MAG: succinate:quinone oxidoreductase subunit C [Methylobacteriaceae bacterium]|jgi:succinate dehydrogenase / fumarate reductase cytochrome b subunit|nr:succinate:quinone oxidoreductase subunit C [Methylobacteriaceae bacterium]
MTEVKAPAARPLSPHVTIYGSVPGKPPFSLPGKGFTPNWTYLMSGFHRATGFAIYLGSVVPVCWMLSMALGEWWYDWFTFLLWCVFPLVALYTWGVAHHTLGGIRHFIWDWCVGLEPDMRVKFAQATILLSVAATGAIWVIAIGLKLFF